MASLLISRGTARKLTAPIFFVSIAILLGFFGLAPAPDRWAGQTINVATTADLQTVVNQYPAGTTFSLAPGIHRLQSVVPQTGDAFVGQTGAILSGAALLTTFT